jgi:hypothetical protein
MFLGKQTSPAEIAMLTDPQIIHFNTFGFVLLQQAFSPTEMQDIIDAANDIWQGDRENQPQAPKHQHMAPFVELHPLLAQLPEDDRIYQPIEQLLGPGFIWGGSEGNKGSFNETNDHQWHCDRAGELDLHYTRIKIMIYFQPMQKDNGALRLIPGSHHPSFHRHLLALQPQKQETSLSVFGVPGPELACYPVEVELGDVVIFNHYLFHGVYGKQEDRSYIAMKFAAQPTCQEHIASLKHHGQDVSKLHDNWRHSQRPRIQGMVQNLLAWE